MITHRYSITIDSRRATLPPWLAARAIGPVAQRLVGDRIVWGLRIDAKDHGAVRAQLENDPDVWDWAITATVFGEPS